MFMCGKVSHKKLKDRHPYDINNKFVTHFATINRKLLLSQYPIKGRNGGMGMIVTTTVSVEGRRITEYKGIVFGEVISGVNFVRDVAASFSNFFGGRSGSYEEELV